MPGLLLTALLTMGGIVFIPGPTAADSPAPPLPIGEALAVAGRSAPRLQGAEARLAAARGVLDQAGRRPNPVLELREENLAFRSVADRMHPGMDYFATFSQRLDLAGKRSRRRDVALAGVEESAADRLETEWQVRLATVSAYLASLRASADVDILTTARADFAAHVSILEQRVEAGHAAAADLMKLRTEAARLQPLLAETELALLRETGQLAALLGEPAPVEPGRLQWPPPLPLPALELPTVLARSIPRHPQHLAAEARLAAARHQLALERAQRIPDPDLIAGYKRTGPFDTVVGAVVVPVPVFDRNQGNVARAEGDLRFAEAELEATDRELRVELSSRWAAARQLLARASTIDRDLVEPAAFVRQATRAAFREGEGNLMALVDAERVLLEALRTARGVQLEAWAQVFAVRLTTGEDPLP